MPTEFPLDALEMALWVRGRAAQDVTRVVHHPDAGSQYSAIRYTDRLTEAGAVASIGTVGDLYDNAMAESVISLYKAECVQIDGPFKTVGELEHATLMWVDWYNAGRLHSSIGAEYEATHYARSNSQDQPVPKEHPLHSTKPGAIHSSKPEDSNPSSTPFREEPDTGSHGAVSWQPGTHVVFVHGCQAEVSGKRAQYSQAKAFGSKRDMKNQMSASVSIYQ